MEGQKLVNKHGVWSMWVSEFSSTISLEREWARFSKLFSKVKSGQTASSQFFFSSLTQAMGWPLLV